MINTKFKPFNLTIKVNSIRQLKTLYARFAIDNKELYEKIEDCMIEKGINLDDLVCNGRIETLLETRLCREPM